MPCILARALHLNITVLYTDADDVSESTFNPVQACSKSIPVHRRGLHYNGIVKCDLVNNIPISVPEWDLLPPAPELLHSTTPKQHLTVDSLKTLPLPLKSLGWVLTSQAPSKLISHGRLKYNSSKLREFQCNVSVPVQKNFVPPSYLGAAPWLCQFYMHGLPTTNW